MPGPSTWAPAAARPLTLDAAMCAFWKCSFFSEHDPTSKRAIASLVGHLEGYAQAGMADRVKLVRTAVVRASINRHFGGKDFVRFFDLSNLEEDAKDLETTILDAAWRAYTLVTNAKSNEHGQICSFLTKQKRVRPVLSFHSPHTARRAQRFWSPERSLYL